MHLIQVSTKVLQDRSADIVEWFDETAPKQNVSTGEIEVPGHGSYLYHICDFVCLVMWTKEARYEHEVYVMFKDLNDAITYRLMFGA